MLFFIIMLCVLGSLPVAIQETYDMNQAESYFEDFINTYSKYYANEEEKQKRFEIFKKTLIKINQQNELHLQEVFGITRFADMTLDEFEDKHTGILDTKSERVCKVGKLNSTVVNKCFPKSFDWRDHNKVSRVKDQDTCGACFSFSATGNIESQYAIMHNQLVEFSEQQLIDCDSSNSQCDGGWMSNAFLYLRKAGGLMSAQDYPYERDIGQCRFKESKVKARVKGCLEFFLKSERQLMKALFDFGPLSITVWVNSFRIYTGGIIRECEKDEQGEINHAVLLVGYGTENGTDYWTIKNSWGEDWGEGGYVRVKRNVNSCNMMSSKGEIMTVVLE